MAVPSKAQQVAEVMRFLDSDRNEGRDLKVIATEIVDGFHDMLLSAIKKPAQPIRPGMLFKDPLGKVKRVAWLEGDTAWLVTDNGSYGWLGKPSDEAWSYCEEYRPKRRVEIDGKGKMVEMTDEEVDQAWSNPDWKPGDRLSQRQREHLFEVVATGPQCVLMRQADGRLMVDSNKSLEQYYKRERSSSQESTLGSDW